MEIAKQSAQISLLRGNPTNPPHSRELEIIELCNHLVHGQIPDAFPGAQPTSLTRQKVGEQLLQEPYLVCEKTDGERHLLLAYQGHVYLIDRKCCVWHCPVQLPLPNVSNGTSNDERSGRAPGWHHNTLLDGELVVDAEDAEGNQTCLRYLVYDAMHIGDEDLTHRPLLYRLKKALFDVILPKEQLLSFGRKANDTIQLMLKDFFELWQIKDVVSIAGKLPHETDGLVFTPVMVPYAPGTCPALLKWKPAHMNTVDFKLEVVFGDGKNMHVKLLVGYKASHNWRVKFSGHWLAKTGKAFKQLKEDPSRFNGKIGECKWHPDAKTFTPTDPVKFTMNGAWEDGGWVLERLREDKHEPNDYRTAKRVVESIEDALTEEELASYVANAMEQNTLQAAATCGDGYLARAKPQVSRAKANWAPAVHGDSHSQGQKGKGKGKTSKGKAKGKGKVPEMNEDIEDIEVVDEAIEVKEDKDDGKGKQDNKEADKKGSHKGKPYKKNSEWRNLKDKGSGRSSGRGKGKGKTQQVQAQPTKRPTEGLDEDHMNLLEWSRIIEAQQAGKDPNKLKEEMMAEAAEAAATVEAAEAVKPEPTEPSAMPSAPPDQFEDETPRLDEVEPESHFPVSRPRTVADLMAWSAWSANSLNDGFYGEAQARSKRPAESHWSEQERRQRPRTVADLDARLGRNSKDFNAEPTVPLLKRSKDLLKRRPRLPQGDGEGAQKNPPSSQQLPAKQPATASANLAFGALGPGYVPPVLGGRR